MRRQVQSGEEAFLKVIKLRADRLAPSTSQANVLVRTLEAASFQPKNHLNLQCVLLVFYCIAIKKNFFLNHEKLGFLASADFQFL